MENGYVKQDVKYECDHFKPKVAQIYTVHNIREYRTGNQEPTT
jgi:hypothetical protein